MATRIVSSMGERSDGGRAMRLGLPRDESAATIVQMYAEEYVLPKDAA